MKTQEFAETRRRRRVGGRLALVAISSLVTVGILEVIFRGIVPQNGVTPFRESEVEGLAYELRPDFETLYKGHRVRMNHHGFRGAEPDDSVANRIALVGDSVTFGNCIALDGTIASCLESELRSRGADVQVLNCGVSGYNIENVYRMTEVKVMPLKPHVLVYVFVSNDIEVGRLKVTIPQDSVIDPYNDFPGGSAFLQFVGVRAKPLLGSLGLTGGGGYVQKVVKRLDKDGGPRLANTLRKFKQLAEAADVPFLVASYPFMVTPKTNPFRPIEERAAAECDKLGVPFVNLADAFDPDENLMNLWSNPFDSHPSAEANLRTATLLADRVESLLDAGQ